MSQINRSPDAENDVRGELAARMRSLPVGNYLIFYRPIANGIEVVRVLHGARNLRRIFKRL